MTHLKFTPTSAQLQNRFARHARKDRAYHKSTKNLQETRTIQRSCHELSLSVLVFPQAHQVHGAHLGNFVIQKPQDLCVTSLGSVLGMNDGRSIVPDGEGEGGRWRGKKALQQTKYDPSL